MAENESFLAITPLFGKIFSLKIIHIYSKFLKVLFRFNV